MNTILNPDRTRKNVISVDEATARSEECPVDIQPDDIFITNAPEIPEGMHNPRLAEDWEEQIAAAITAKLPTPEVWTEAAPQTEIDALLTARNNQQRIAELKTLLADSDYKDLPNYRPKPGEVMSDVIATRDAWREELRALL